MKGFLIWLVFAVPIFLIADNLIAAPQYTIDPQLETCKPATVFLVISAGDMSTLSRPVVIPSGETRVLFLHSTVVVLDNVKGMGGMK